MNKLNFSFQGKQHRICQDDKIESFKQNLVLGGSFCLQSRSDIFPTGTIIYENSGGISNVLYAHICKHTYTYVNTHI